MRPLLVAALLLLFALQAITAVRTKSATWDETNYFGMGDYLLRNGRWDVPSAVIHPPLAYYLDSIPLLFAQLDRSVWDYPSMRRDRPFLGAADPDRGQSLLSSPANRDDRLLTLSRLMVVLQALLLGLFIYRFGSALFGEAAGMLAVAFFAFCPDMLAHGALITPDMTVTVFFFIAVYYFRQALVRGHASDFVLAGVALGLALLSKFTAILLVPIGVLLAVAAVATVRARIPFKWLLVSLATAALVFLAAYRFNPAPYFEGLAIQGLHGGEGHNAFLLGRLSKEGWWYYCLVAFLLKTPIALLLCVVAAFVLLARDAVSRRLSFDALVAWLPVVAVFGVFSVELRSIGLRYVLPAYPFIFVIAGGVIARFPRWKYVSAAVMLWFLASSVLAWPHYLAYFNEIAGGADNGYRYLVDSNLDWGQDLKGLKQYMDAHGLDRINLSYFGTDSPARYGIRYDWLPSYELRNPNPKQTIRLRRGEYVAISVTNLQGVYMEPPTMFRWLDRYTPIARIGHSIFVYRLD